MRETCSCLFVYLFVLYFLSILRKEEGNHSSQSTSCLVYCTLSPERGRKRCWSNGGRGSATVFYQNYASLWPSLLCSLFNLLSFWTVTFEQRDSLLITEHLFQVPHLDSVVLFLHSPIQSKLYFFHTSSNNGLQPIDAPNFAQSRNDPDIFRWSEYVSSGGGDRRWRNIIGRSSLMRLVVSWAWKLNGSLLAKGSPRIITASACALIITYHKDSKQRIKQINKILIPRSPVRGSGPREGPRQWDFGQVSGLCLIGQNFGVWPPLDPFQIGNTRGRQRLV